VQRLNAAQLVDRLRVVVDAQIEHGQELRLHRDTPLQRIEVARRDRIRRDDHP
jgi:hypothetical protein